MRFSPPVSPAKSLKIVVVLALATALACSPEDKSNLEKMAQEQNQESSPDPKVGETKTEATPGGKVEGTEPTPPPKQGSAWPVDDAGVPIPLLEGPAKLINAGAEEDRVTLRLSLEEGSRYRVTTLGMLKLPLLDRSTGFAREEEVSLSGCTGEAAARNCLATHTYRNYEAEPPAGSGLEGDEAMVSALETAHRIDASGLRSSDTAVHGESSPQIAKQLGQAHRLYCLRLPEEAIGIGATWRDVCRMRQGGSLVTRELTWRLAKIERGEDGVRAELEYAGRLRRLDAKGKVVNGEIKGAVYFWVDAGEPHLMRERIAFVLNAANGVSTTTDLRYQFARLDEDGETLLRTDGKPFEQSPNVLNDPRSAPLGATRDGELSVGQK